MQRSWLEVNNPCLNFQWTKNWMCTKHIHTTGWHPSLQDLRQVNEMMMMTMWQVPDTNPGLTRGSSSLSTQFSLFLEVFVSCACVWNNVVLLLFCCKFTLGKPPRKSSTGWSVLASEMALESVSAMSRGWANSGAVYPSPAADPAQQTDSHKHVAQLLEWFFTCVWTSRSEKVQMKGKQPVNHTVIFPLHPVTIDFLPGSPPLFGGVVEPTTIICGETW